MFNEADNNIIKNSPDPGSYDVLFAQFAEQEGLMGCLYCPTLFIDADNGRAKLWKVFYSVVEVAKWLEMTQTEIDALIIKYKVLQRSQIEVYTMDGNFMIGSNNTKPNTKYIDNYAFLGLLHDLNRHSLYSIIALNTSILVTKLLSLSK